MEWDCKGQPLSISGFGTIIQLRWNCAWACQLHNIHKSMNCIINYIHSYANIFLQFFHYFSQVIWLWWRWTWKEIITKKNFCSLPRGRVAVLLLAAFLLSSIQLFPLVINIVNIIINIVINIVDIIIIPVILIVIIFFSCPDIDVGALTLNISKELFKITKIRPVHCTGLSLRDCNMKRASNIFI